MAVMATGIVTLIKLPVHAANIGDGWTSATDVSMVSEMVFETSIGHAWLAAMIGTGLLLAAWSLRNRLHQAGIAIASGLLLATLAITGHAAMDSGGLGVAHAINQVVHLLAGGAWLGGLVAFVVILPRLDDPEARLALMRYSTLGHAAVALVIATGVINTLLIVGAMPFDWVFAYQRLLVLKILLVALMAGLAIANRYVFVPRLTHDRPHALKALARCTLAEIAIGAIVLALVAWFGTLEPN
jgi:putative copper resistance protein D